MACRLALVAVVVATASALVPPTRPLQRAGALQPPSTRPIAGATAVATALIPTVALADFGTWISGLGTQDYVALGVLAFLVIFVIPSLVGDILENQADPAAAIAKKQQKLKDLEDKYSFLVGDAPAPAPAPAADAPPADEFTQRKAAADAAASDEADALLASVKAMTNKD
ncbi:unnamed protein product [Pelagomonas calceolata]|uniref:Uncharacterized protein n=1 Tax=Pelagomonas calceolata TaxID=35677 RepID=A0A8J2SNH3_9STRA|nr:unnamed protein product [Pelagomonas calceolata]